MTDAELRAAREKLGMTQVELGEALGIHANLISRWELSKAKAPPYLALAIEALLARAKPEPVQSQNSRSASVPPAVFETWAAPEPPKVVVEPISEDVPSEKVEEVKKAIEETVGQTPGGLPTQVYEVEKF